MPIDPPSVFPGEQVLYIYIVHSPTVTIYESLPAS
jgi:hypothetical protein